jgi:hypothetical protein
MRCLWPLIIELQTNVTIVGYGGGIGGGTASLGGGDERVGGVNLFSAKG